MAEQETHAEEDSHMGDAVNIGRGDFVRRDKIVHGDEVHGDKVVSSRSQLEELQDYLARAVAAFKAHIYQIIARPALVDRPYKFLYPFEVEDERIFFGRERAVDALYQKLMADPLTVLHARSGAGKTSLLNAGLSPHLIREGRLPVYARAYEDPALAIKRAIVPPSLGPWPELLPKLTLQEFLGLACQHLGQTLELVVLLDQFEEFFVFWPEREQRQPFIDQLADCYDDNQLRVRLVIGIRGDYFTHLATCQDRLPHIFHNEYYLGTMTREEAHTAITGPVAKLSHPVDYEPELLGTLLDDLARGGMELPHLQIICARLYETLAEGEPAITLARYKELGQAEGVLGGYLNDVLDKLPGRGEAIAKEVLKELVSSEATPRVLSDTALAARIAGEPEELDGVLVRLVNARLLIRREEATGETAYEMAHQYLIGEIRMWIDQADLKFKQVEELLMREVANWRVHRTLIPEDRLELLHAQQERFRGFDDETSECLLQSALEADFPVDDWVKLVSEIGEKILLAALAHKRQSVRWGAAQGLGLFWVLPAVSELGSRDGSLRQAAAEALGELGDARAVKPLIAALKDENAEVRQAAAGALGEMGDPHADAVEPLIAVLKDENVGVRQAAAGALGEMGDRHAVEPLIAALGDGNINVRRSATHSLGLIWDLQLVSDLGSIDSAVRRAAAEALGDLGDRHTVEPVIAALQDENAEVRQAAAEALGDLGDRRAVEPLIAVLQDENAEVRQAAAEALGRLDDPRAVKPLIAVLKDENAEVRQVAARALGEIGGPHAVELLITSLGNEDIHVRRAATDALVEIGQFAVQPLISALGDRLSAVREAAARALGEIGDPLVVQPLIGILGQSSFVHRSAFGKHGDPDAIVRRAAAEALGKIGDPHAVQPLIGALGQSSFVRRAVSGKHRDSDAVVRRAAAWALGELADPRAVEPLISALGDEASAVREAAARALGEIGDPRAVQPLIGALDDEDWNVRRTAAKSLDKIGTPEALAGIERFR
jgi:HEAT repeat protein